MWKTAVSLTAPWVWPSTGDVNESGGFSTWGKKPKNHPQGVFHISTKFGGMVEKTLFVANVDVGGDVLNDLGGLRALLHHLFKRETYNNRRIKSNSKFLKNNLFIFILFQKTRIPVGCLMPRFIFHKIIITTEIHSHIAATHRTFWYKF